VATQRLCGYVFWTKRRFAPASNRFAAIVLLAEAADPEVYLVPSNRVARKEVCDALEVSPGNQRVLLHRARSHVRAALERHLNG
jgi:DNA-directed RNA polymerase specialized sigma24 family protein